MNMQTTMKTIYGTTIITRESIPPDTFVGETKEQYLARIGMQECPRKDAI